MKTAREFLKQEWPDNVQHWENEKISGIMDKYCTLRLIQILDDIKSKSFIIHDSDEENKYYDVVDVGVIEDQINNIISP